MKIKPKMISRFGVYSDPSQSRWLNLFNHVLSLPILFLSSRLANPSCHNLCTINTPPKHFRSLLGLGLKFCPTPSHTTSRAQIESSLSRFRTDFLTKVFFCDKRFDPHNTWTPGQLYLRSSDWSGPQLHAIPPEIHTRVSAFLSTIRPMFHKRRVRRNLTPIQERLLESFSNNPDFLVVPSDKNLGPVLLDRTTYVRRCLDDHLLHPTYERLTSTAANNFTSETTKLLQSFLQAHDQSISAGDTLYLHRYLASVTDPYAYFYALIKVHKSPWQTRPIVSVSGSTLYGLGKWLDRQLQPLIKTLPTYLPSSFTLKQELDKMGGTNFSRMSLFTGDIVAMYPSIQIHDAFEKIASYFTTLDTTIYPPNLINAILSALQLIMTRNCFRFGDTFWLQKDGTAMGTPPAPSFATLYYGIFELELLQSFGSHLHYLRHYIDDQFGIWIHDPDPQVDCQRWLDFKNRQSQFCSLNWVFSSLSSSVHFLDLTIHLEPYQISTSLYEKPLNLHLYIPWNSAHAPHIRKSVITSGIFRILRLITHRSEQQLHLAKFFTRLLARGYNHSFLYSTFQHALNRFATRTNACLPRTSVPELFWPNSPPLHTTDESAFFHLPYHPQDPPSRLLQSAFREHIFHPVSLQKKRIFARTCDPSSYYGAFYNGDEWVRAPPRIVQLRHVEPKLTDLRNLNGQHIPIDRLIVAYHRAPNLKNLLFPRHSEGKCPSATSVSSTLDLPQDDEATDIPSHN